MKTASRDAAPQRGGDDRYTGFGLIGRDGNRADQLAGPVAVVVDD